MRITIIPLGENTVDYANEVCGILKEKLHIVNPKNMHISLKNEGGAGLRIKVAEENSTHIILLGTRECETGLIYLRKPEDRPMTIDNFVLRFQEDGWVVKLK